MLIRSPIVSVLGHVDHGKTTLLDAIRGSAVAKKEPGRITQMIGASYIRRNVIEDISRDLTSLKFKLVIPGLLFVDTPGHEAFTSMRERGGSIADIAILVIDINQGVQPQTVEAIKILKSYKTPFIIAATKVDLLQGWINTKSKSILYSIKKQREDVKLRLDEKLYEIVGKIAEYGFDSERFDRVESFTKQIAIVPVSAITKEGLAELLMLVAGLSQKYLEKQLEIDENAKAKGTIIEVKEEKGLGETIDVIIYDGVLKKGDEIVFLKRDGVAFSKVRALLQPNIASNNPSEKYVYVDRVVAAAGVKIFAPNLGGALAGSPFGVRGAIDEESLRKSLSNILFEKKETKGLLVKVDSLGSAEALLGLLKSEDIPVAKIDIGAVTKEDIMYAKAMQDIDPHYGVILAFNVKVSKEILSLSNSEGVPIIWSNVIYNLVDMFKEWLNEFIEKEKKEIMQKLTYPVELKVLPGFFFRMSKPAIFGIEVLGGILKPGIKLMNANGVVLGEVKGVQDKGESLKSANVGSKVAISVDGPVLGKDIHEGDILYSFISKKEIDVLETKSILKDEDKEVLRKIKKIILSKSLKK